ncbi:MAG: hypothetical protein RR338_00740 [Clostridia bacterium]
MSYCLVCGQINTYSNECSHVGCKREANTMTGWGDSPEKIVNKILKEVKPLNLKEYDVAITANDGREIFINLADEDKLFQNDLKTEISDKGSVLLVSLRESSNFYIIPGGMVKIVDLIKEKEGTLTSVKLVAARTQAPSQQQQQAPQQRQASQQQQAPSQWQQAPQQQQQAPSQQQALSQKHSLFKKRTRKTGKMMFRFGCARQDENEDVTKNDEGINCEILDRSNLCSEVQNQFDKIYKDDGNNIDMKKLLKYLDERKEIFLHSNLQIRTSEIRKKFEVVQHNLIRLPSVRLFMYLIQCPDAGDEGVPLFLYKRNNICVKFESKTLDELFRKYRFYGFGATDDERNVNDVLKNNDVIDMLSYIYFQLVLSDKIGTNERLTLRSGDKSEVDRLKELLTNI